MKTWQELLRAAQAAAEAAKAIEAKASGQMTPAERGQYDAKVAEALRLKAEGDAEKKAAEQRAKVQHLMDVDGDVPSWVGDDDDHGTKAGGSAWACEVTFRLGKAAQGHGVKALLTGEVRTPSVVDVVALPDKPRRLLDLIARVPATDNRFSYLRQTVKTNNAAPVADNQAKPTSTYTWAEIEGQCQVIAHLSEPFPLRYLQDHETMVQVLDDQMVSGVEEALEQQVMSGTGVGPQLPGILTTTGLTVVPFTTDVLTTVRHARTVLGNKGELATGWVFHPADAEKIDLMRENGATGGWLNSADALDTIFGRGVARVESLAVPEGTALLADWRQIQILVREDAATLAATQAGDLFDKNQVKLRSEGRYGVRIRRPQAFARVSLVAA